ncbi:UNVERIFIED_ORG: TRAP-type C4-dicarboxylate transport system permease small subunit [Martelella mediterranea]
MNTTTEKRRPVCEVLGPDGPVDRLISVVERGMLWILCGVLFFMMVLISGDAIARYTMNRPFVFTVDLVTLYLLPATMLLPAGMVLRHGGQIGVDLFAMMMPRRLYSLLVCLGMLAAVPVFWTMTTSITKLARDSWSQDLVATGLVPWPIWSEQAIVALAMGLFTMRALHIALSQLIALVTGNEKAAISILPDDDEREITEEAV